MMTDRLKEFLKKASVNEEIQKKLDALKEETDQEKVIETSIQIAEEAGIALTEEDFQEAGKPVDDKEMEDVTGGVHTRCYCFVGGGGTGNDLGAQTCACVSYGGGCDERGRLDCACYIGGSGN